MLETIVSIIRQAGALLLSAHAKERDISSKEGKANFVTKYDIAVQQFLQQRLQAARPSQRPCRAPFWISDARQVRPLRAAMCCSFSRP